MSEPTTSPVEVAARPDHILPGLFWPSGLYCFHEGGGLFMVGKSFPDDPVGLEDFSWERRRFEERIDARKAQTGNRIAVVDDFLRGDAAHH